MASDTTNPELAALRAELAEAKAELDRPIEWMDEERFIGFKWSRRGDVAATHARWLVEDKYKLQQELSAALTERDALRALLGGEVYNFVESNSRALGMSTTGGKFLHGDGKSVRARIDAALQPAKGDT